MFLAGASAACALVALSAPAFAQTQTQTQPQTQPPADDCMPTETKAECFARLKCKPKEDLEECKKRIRTEKKQGKAGEGGEGDKNRGEGDKNRGEGDKNRGEGDKNRGEGRDHDNRGRDHDRDADRNRRRDRDQEAQPRRRDRDNDRGRRERERPRDQDRGGGGGGGGGGEGGGGGGGGGHGHGILRPGTHPGFFSGGIGPSWGVCYRGDCNPNRVDYAAFYGSLDFGWHLTGDFHGPALGANIHGGYGSFTGYNDGRFGAGFKFWWDIQMGRDLGLYFTPFAQAGWSSFIYENRRFNCALYGSCTSNWEHFFNIQAGAMIRMILGDRGLVYFQPMTFDNVMNGNGYGLLYHFEIGGGVIFGG